MIEHIGSHLYDLRTGGRRVAIRKLRTAAAWLQYAIGALLLLPVIIFIRALRPIIVVRFGRIINTRIGEYAPRVELYLCQRDVSAHRTFDLFHYEDRRTFCNQQLRRMFDRTGAIRAWEIVRYLSLANRLIPGHRLHTVETSERDVQNLCGPSSPHLTFTDREEQEGRAGLRNMGIPDGSRFICFHARDASYLNDLYPDRNFSCHNYRDATIDNYVPAADALTKRGYYTVRLGSVVGKPLQTDNPKIIDYATEFRSDFLDIYLCAKCDFLFCSASGMNEVSEIFRRPIVYVNFIPLEYVESWDSDSITIFKKLWLTKERRYMTFREIIDSGAGRFLSTEEYASRGIEPVENTAEEITAAVLEMQERLQGRWISTEDDDVLQRHFWSLFKPGALHGEITARIGTSFLRQNMQLLHERL